MSTGLQRRLSRAGLAVGIAIALTLAWAGYLRLTGNFHTVEQGVIYRWGNSAERSFKAGSGERYRDGYQFSR